MAACAVLANEAGIRRLLLILLDNGVKYTHAGGTVNVSLASEDARIWVTIRDSGKGIGPEHLPHIFERFYRADASRTGNEGRGPRAIHRADDCRNSRNKN